MRAPYTLRAVPPDRMFRVPRPGDVPRAATYCPDNDPDLLGLELVGFVPRQRALDGDVGEMDHILRLLGQATIRAQLAESQLASSRNRIESLECSVERAANEAEFSQRPKVDVEPYISFVCEALNVTRGKLKSSSQEPVAVMARALLTRIFRKDLELQICDIALHLNIGRSAIQKYLSRGSPQRDQMYKKMRLSVLAAGATWDVEA